MSFNAIIFDLDGTLLNTLGDITDSVVDIQTALSAGMCPAGALWGFQPGELVGSDAHALIKHPIEIIKYLI
jgi:phosphoglycolate phosphatase-like HAD superfamily hydrolase